MSLYTDISFINIDSSEIFFDEARKVKDEKTVLFCIKAPLRAEEADLEAIRETADVFRKSLSIIVLVIDSVIDYTFLDCIIGADICLVTSNGKCNIQSRYFPTGIYTNEQIKYLLAGNEDDIFASSIDADGNFINGPLITDLLTDTDTEAQLTERVNTYVNSMTLGKKTIQMKRIKEYFNTFKEEGWNRREDIMNQESRQFCYLAHQINEV